MADSCMQRRRSQRLAATPGNRDCDGHGQSLRTRRSNAITNDSLGDLNEVKTNEGISDGASLSLKNLTPKKNLWKGTTQVSTPLSRDTIDLATACKIMISSPDMNVPNVSDSPKSQLLKETKIIIGGIQKTKLLRTPTSCKKVSLKDSIENGLQGKETEELQQSSNIQNTPKSGATSCDWKAIVVEDKGNTPVLKLHRLNLEVQLSSDSVGSTKASPLNTPTRPVTTLKGIKSAVRRLDSSLTEASPQSSVAITPRRSSRKKTEAYYGNSIAGTSESDSDFDDSLSSSDSDSDSESLVAEEEDDRSKESCNTPKRSNSMSHVQTSLCFTPKVARALAEACNGDFSPRRTPDINKLKNTPRSESYFIAEKRIKFGTPQSVRKAVELRKVKEAKTGAKKPRKGNRQGIDKAMSKMPISAPEFSVSKESSKIPLDAEWENPWYVQHEEAVEKLHEDIVRDFPRWVILLREGFSIMLHGYGSKKPILNTFINMYVEDKHPWVLINGQFPKFNPRKFVTEFAQSLDPDFNLKPSTVHNMTLELLQKFGGTSQSPYFIFIINFDLLAARHPQMLSALCGLSRLPFVYIIASSDHINAGLGIPPCESLQLNFTWIDCTTFVEYSDELVWDGNFFGNSADGPSGKNSLEHILKSLTANAKKAFGLLAGLQLRKKKTKSKAKNFQGVEFRELLRVCRDSFVAHSELVLKSLLTEFIDHKLIHYSGKGKHDDNFLIIDLADETLEKYAEN